MAHTAQKMRVMPAWRPEASPRTTAGIERAPLRPQQLIHRARRCAVARERHHQQAPEEPDRQRAAHRAEEHGARRRDAAAVPGHARLDGDDERRVGEAEPEAVGGRQEPRRPEPHPRSEQERDGQGGQRGEEEPTADEHPIAGVRQEPPAQGGRRWATRWPWVRSRCRRRSGSRRARSARTAGRRSPSRSWPRRRGHRSRRRRPSPAGGRGRAARAAPGLAARPTGRGPARGAPPVPRTAAASRERDAVSAATTATVMSAAPARSRRCSWRSTRSW